MTLWPALSPAISANISLAIPMSYRRTCRARAASTPQTTFTMLRRKTARPWASSQVRRHWDRSQVRRERGSIRPGSPGWGAPTTDSHVCLATNSPQVKVKTVKDLYENELIVGAPGAGTGVYYFPKALSALLGLKFKIVAGFRSATEVFLAMERPTAAQCADGWDPKRRVSHAPEKAALCYSG